MTLYLVLRNIVLTALALPAPVSCLTPALVFAPTDFLNANHAAPSIWSSGVNPSGKLPGVRKNTLPPRDLSRRGYRPLPRSYTFRMTVSYHTVTVGLRRGKVGTEKAMGPPQ